MFLHLSLLWMLGRGEGASVVASADCAREIFNESLFLDYGEVKRVYAPFTLELNIFVQHVVLLERLLQTLRECAGFPK